MTKFPTSQNAFADDKINLTEKLKFLYERAENIVGKGENTCYQDLFFFLRYFQKAFYTMLFEVLIV